LGTESVTIGYIPSIDHASVFCVLRRESRRAALLRLDLCVRGTEAGTERVSLAVRPGTSTFRKERAMSVIRRPTIRLFLILAAGAALFVAGAATASGKGRSSGGQPTVVVGAPTAAGVGVASSSVGVTSSAGVASMPALAPYPWCCPSLPGVTATGQASVHGQGSTARDQAIARAVADAIAQAQSAATAAHITLGAIVDMQVSAAPNVYPVPLGSTSGGSGPTPPTPVQTETFASVTITWAIA
jgi:hypothetical protein